MLDALRLLQELGLREEDETLRSVGSPLIEVGYPLAYSPRLGPGSLIISGERYGKRAAEAMQEQIPEIKGVILSRGVAGVVDPGKKPLENVLLAGCDMRADISQSLFGETVIYKNQSRMHIEFSRQSAPKMRILEQLYLQGKLRDVVDGLSGPGTLGLMCVLAGARRVVLNDAWLAGVQNVLLNLEINRSLLGIDEIEYPETSQSAVGKEPVLVGRASGPCEIEVYHGDLRRLFSRARPADICLIDHFPGANTAELEKACRCCKEIVVV
jgi:ribosomal protein L35AE/L33A